MEVDKELVEKIAKALFHAGGGGQWEVRPSWLKDHYRKLAEIAIMKVMESLKVTG